MDDLRNTVWEKMVDADRLHRYHGEQAGKFARQQRWIELFVAVLGVVVALVAIVATDSTLMQVVAAGMAIGALYVALLRPGKRSLEAVNCARQLGDLTDEWKSLWRQVNGSEAEDETAPLALRALSARTNAVTAPLAQERVDKKILRTTEEKTYAYWKEIAGSDTGSTDTRKAIAASPEEAIATT